MSLKEIAGKEISKRVKDGQIIGVGTGSTVDLALEAIGKRVAQEGLNIQVVPTSLQSAWRCEELGFTVCHPGCDQELVWGFDGADAVDSELRLIKGKGGAQLKEKILAAKCRDYFIIIDESKFSDNIAELADVPVEVIPEALSIVKKELTRLSPLSVKLREASAKHGPVITELGNIILDVKFSEITENLERDIKAIVGVVESGLFTSYATEVLIGTSKGLKVLKK